jgi:hypothetical protein
MVLGSSYSLAIDQLDRFAVMHGKNRKMPAILKREGLRLLSVKLLF